MANWEISVAFILSIITFVLFYNAFNMDRDKHATIAIFSWLLGWLFIVINLGVAIEIAQANSAPSDIISIMSITYGLMGFVWLIIFFYFMTFMVMWPLLWWLLDRIHEYSGGKTDGQRPDQGP